MHNKRLEIGSRWVCQELAMEFNAQYRHYVEKGGGGGESLGQTGFDDPEQPVTWVSWHEAQSFCKWASQYSPWPMGLPARVGGRPVSPFGAEDLSENVWEWCADPYRPSEDDTLRPADDTQNTERLFWFSDCDVHPQDLIDIAPPHKG